MISVRVNSHRFHYRAAAIVLDADCLLLHRLEGDDFWALPGGRVNAGERAGEAIAREFMEELGVRVECKGLACTGENFFHHNNEPHHELGLYFFVALPADSPVASKQQQHFGIEGTKRLEFRWFQLTDLPGLDMRPSALKQGLRMGNLPHHFVQQG